MNSLLPDDPEKWGDVLGAPQRLLYNRPSDCLVLAVSRGLDGGLSVQRLYYRRLPESAYRPVAARHLLESQQDAHCCEAAPFLVFNEMRFQEPRPAPAYLQQLLKGKAAPPPVWGADWLGIRRLNLETGEDKRVLDEETLRPAPPYTSGWVSQVLNVSADGSGAVCAVGLTAGGSMNYFVYEVSFTEGLKRKIAELPRVFG